ncbi:MAG: type II toxin-antitoxin system death-on-curing family toxin [Vicinamibacterales bacterium]
MTPGANDCLHLTVDDVGLIHERALARFGGLDGVRDVALLESAVAAPQAGFGGQSVYTDLVEIAAAYLFYICRNHPFLDGNKRTGLGACILFLHLNGIETPPDDPEWEGLVVDVASGHLDRDGATARLRQVLK